MAQGAGGTMILLVLAMTSVLVSAGKSWLKGPSDLSNHIDGSTHHKSHLRGLEVVCSKDHMTVHMHFDEPFYGVVFSHGGQRHERCVHVGPRAGIQDASFQIHYDSCGTVEHLSGRFHENTIVVQFGEDILEAWDEAKRLRCEWLESFEKPSSKPTLAISDLDVVELNFQGDDIDCWMEVQEGKGPWARQVGGLVPIGSPLTLVIAINDHSGQFDMRIKRCSAGDGTGAEIELTDNNGCVIRPSLLTPFAKVKDLSAKATLVAYSHIYAFKFPDKIDVYVHCIVEVCRHGCPDTCSHQKDYFNNKGIYDTLESKKHIQLIELAKSKPLHNIHVSGHHQAVKSEVFGAYPQPGRERNRDVLVPAAQTQVKQVVSKNSTISLAIVGGKKVLQQTATFKPKTISQTNHKNNKVQSDSISASSNAHGVIADIGNSLHSEHNKKFTPHDSPHDNVPPDDKLLLGSTYHRIIGHDVHWVSDGKNPAEVPSKQPLIHHTEIPYQAPSQFPNSWSNNNVKSNSKENFHKNPIPLAPQPEPAPWSADDVKPLTKQQVFLNHAPQPHPAAWSADEVKFLGKQETFINQHVPQPEPAVWAADDVKPLTKEEVFHQQPKPQTDLNYHDFQLEKIVPEHPLSSPYNEKSHVPLIQKQYPGKTPLTYYTERVPVTFEEINPMYNPEAFRLKLHTKPPDEPQPEPAAWTLDDVKPLSKDDLRLISLNYKIKNDPNLALPVYKESIQHYSTSTIPQPAYVPRYTNSPRNMSSMNMKMMMMPTLLPPTYQTAQWPQRPTTRFLRPNRHHHPYPIPQFGHHQQIMLGVIADRRMDENSEDISGDVLSSHNMASKEEKTSGTVFSGDTNVNKTDEIFKEIIIPEEEGTLNSEVTNSMNDKKIQIGETFNSKTTTISDDSTSLPISSQTATEKLTFKTPMYLPISRNDEFAETASNTKILPETIDNQAGAPPIRPPVSGFVPPSLDLTGINPEMKDRTAHGPRALNRRKRSSEPVFGVQQKFQAIAPSDLAFEWNLTDESASVLKGRREEIVYGICVSPAGMSAGVGFILILTLLAIIASVVLYEHSCLLTKKTSQLSFFTRNFNGQFEALYKFTRPYLYSGRT